MEVLGTKFNVVAEPADGLFSTALFEGQVQVTSRLFAGERVILSPDNMVRLEDGHLAVSRIADRDDYLWTEGIINLTGVRFEELMRRFEKAFGVKIVLERVPDFHIGQGKIRQSVGIDNALRMLQQFARFTYTHDEQNNTIIIR